MKPELLRERINLLNTVDPYIGRYYSTDWVKKNVLQMSDDEIELMNKEMQQEGPVVTQPEVDGQDAVQPPQPNNADNVDTARG